MKRLVAIVIAAVAASTPLAAQEKAAVSTTTSFVEKFFGGNLDRRPQGSFSVGLHYDVWYTDFTAEAKIDTGALLGTQVDLIPELGVEGEKDINHINIHLGLSRLRLDIGYRRQSYEGNQTLARTISFDGSTFTVADTVRTRFAMNVTNLQMTINVLNNTFGPAGMFGLQLGPSIGFKVFDLEASIESRSTALSAEESITVPFPYVGLRAEVLLARYITVIGTFHVFSAGLGDIDAEYSFVEIRVQFNLNRFIGVFGGFRQEKVRVLDESDSKENNRVAFRTDGAFVGVEVGF